MTPHIETRSLCKHYRGRVGKDVRALEDVSLTVPRGAFLALTGPSGSGKTTLLALLGALDRPTRGDVHFDGVNLSAQSDAALARVRRRMGFVFQDFALIPGLSVWENVTYPLIPRGVRRSLRRKTAAILLSRLGIADRLDDNPRDLSGGEQQRVAVARALVGEPEILFGDEPTSNLDPATAQDLFVLLRDCHARGTTVVVVTHDPRLTALATVVYELQAGRLGTITRNG